MADIFMIDDCFDGVEEDDCEEVLAHVKHWYTTTFTELLGPGAVAPVSMPRHSFSSCRNSQTTA